MVWLPRNPPRLFGLELVVSLAILALSDWPEQSIFLHMIVFLPFANCGVGKRIGLGVVLARNVGYREPQGARQFTARPVEGIKPRAAALILTHHLLHDNLGI